MVEAVLAYTLKCIDEASSTMDRVKSSMGLLGSTVSELGGGFSSLGNVMTGFAAAGGLGAVVIGVGEVIGGVQDSIEVFANFEEMINRVAASTGATGEEFEMLKDTAVKVSTDMGVSATEAAKALYYMAGGAIGAEQAAALLEPAVRLSQIGMIDLRDASIMTSDIMTQFGLVSDDATESAESMSHVVDVLATAITSSQTEMWELSEALKYVGPLAKTLGFDFEETIAALGLMADHGVKASIAGTGLKDMMTDLAGPTQKAKDLMEELGINVLDAQGEMLPLAEIIDVLNEAFDGMTAAQKEAALATIFGKEHVGKMLILLEEGGDTLRTYAQDLRENADSSEMFERQTDSLAKAQERASAAWEAAQIALGEKLRPVVIAAQGWIADLGLAFSDGIDSVSAWLDEVGRIPEVQGIMTDLQDVFADIWSYLQDLWGFLVESFSPALQELFEAFGELWDALSPIGEAISEVIQAITGTEGDFDIFKELIKAVAFEITAIAEAIKLVAPYIREFAEAFKAAVEFITPILKEIVDGIAWFLGELRKAFQGFYDWLVGGSLWMDMWNQILAIASTMIGTLLGDLGSKLFEPIKNAFTGAMQAVQDLWDTGWQNLKSAGETVWDLIQGSAKAWEALLKGDFQSALDQIKQNWDTAWNAVQSTFTTISGEIKSGITQFLDSAKTTVATGIDKMRSDWDQGWNQVKTTFQTVSKGIQDEVGTRFDEMKEFVRSNLGEYAPIAENALTLMQGTMSLWEAAIKGDWKSALDIMKGNLDTFWRMIQQATDLAFTNLKTAFTNSMNAVKNTLQGAVNTMQGLWQGFMNFINQGIANFQSTMQGASNYLSGILSSMESTASSALGTISSIVNSALASIASAAQGLWNYLVGGSIWTDMLEEMQSQTHAALGNIVSDFEGAFGDITLAAPVAAPVGPAGRMGVAAPGTVPAGQIVLTIPVTVTLDGQVISRQIERRMVERAKLRGKKVA